MSAICLPLAVLLGYLVASPGSSTSILVIGCVLTGLCIPVLLKHHYWILLFSWNAVLSVFFLPGQTQLWMMMAFTSFSIAFLNRALNHTGPPQGIRSVSWTLLILLATVIITAQMRGGIGIRSLGGGGKIGGQYYFYIIFAVLGYFALSRVRIPPSQVSLTIGLFFLGTATAAVSNLIYFAGERFYWLYWVFPVNNAYEQIAASMTGNNLVRLSGFSMGSVGLFYWMLARFGMRGILQRPLRLIGMVCIIGLSLAGGFRSIFFGLMLVSAIQFCLEGLWRTRYTLVLVGCLLVGAAIAIPFANKMPLSVQRALSFLPIEIDQGIRMDAAASTEWRLNMWRMLLPQIPEYLLLGKGFAVDESDMYLTELAQKMGLRKDYELSAIVGNYHSGPLSVLLPFGIWGLFAFLGFCWTAIRVLYRNYKFGEPRLHLINTLLLSVFLAKFFTFWVIFGSLPSDLPVFVGWVALSIALNGGMRKKENTESPQACPLLINQTA